MKETMDNLVQSLREDLIQYAEMLTLLEDQQELIVNRSADGLIQNLTAIHSQMAEIAKGAPIPWIRRVDRSTSRAPRWKTF